MSRIHARLATMLTTTLLLVAATALPALAAAGTKPDPDANPYLIGSIGELAIAAVLGAGIGVLVMAMRPSGPAETDDHH